MGKRTAIIDARVRAFTASPRREAVLWDGVVSGLGVRARASGRKTWIVQRRIGDALVKRTLSAAEAMTVEHARCAARALIADAECGDGAALSVPTMQSFGPTFLADCAERWRAGDQDSARALHAAIHPACVWQPTHRCDHGARRAELVRRAVGNQCGDGEPLAGGAVVTDEGTPRTWGCARRGRTRAEVCGDARQASRRTT